MRYMLMIYGDEHGWVSASEDDRRAMYARYESFGARNGDVIRGGAELQTTRAASTVRVRDGETLVTDGPFAETKEQLGGFYIVEVASEEEARAIAAQIPGAEHGAIEVRPLVEAEERPQAAATAEGSAR